MTNLTKGAIMKEVDHERVEEIRSTIWKLAEEVRSMKRKTLPTFGVWNSLFMLGCRANGMFKKEAKDEKVDESGSKKVET